MSDERQVVMERRGSDPCIVAQHRPAGALARLTTMAEAPGHTQTAFEIL